MQLVHGLKRTVSPALISLVMDKNSQNTFNVIKLLHMAGR